MDQIVTLASMIEKEAANREDYARVSAVFHNRLRLGMKLESDPTATYLTGEHKLALSDAETGAINNYNTYYVPGLPVGPICNPSVAALEAAQSPDMDYINEGYLYFCAMEPTSGQLASPSPRRSMTPTWPCTVRCGRSTTGGRRWSRPRRKSGPRNSPDRVWSVELKCVADAQAGSALPHSTSRSLFRQDIIS